MIHKEIIERIKKSIDLVSLIDGEVGLKKKGKYFFGRCPFHDDRSPSFAVHPEKRTFHCYGCGIGGDAIAYLMKSRGMSFRESIKALADSAGISLNQGNQNINFKLLGLKKRISKPISSASKKAESIRISSPCAGESWQCKANEFCRWCNEDLLVDDRKMRQLRRRGIHRKTISAMQLGVNYRDRYEDRSAWGLPVESNGQGQKKKLWLPKGLVIPRFDGQGHVSRIRIRPADGRRLKYYVLPGSDTATYWVPGPTTCVTIVESELDGFLIHETAGDLTSVAAMGSSSTRPDRFVVQMLKKAAWIMVVPDFDSAGKKMAAWWLKQFDKVTIWPVPAGKDPGEAYKAGVDIRSWIKTGLPKAWVLKENV